MENENEKPNFDEMSRKELVDYIKKNNLAKENAPKDVHFATTANLVALCKGELAKIPVVVLGAKKQGEGEIDFGDEVAATETKTAAKPAVAANPADPMSVINALGQLMGASTLNEDGVKSICTAYLNSDAGRELIKKNATIKKVSVVVNGAPAVEIKGKTHEKFERVLKLAALDLPILLVGPAGTGKTHLARQVAEALGRPFSYNSMSAGVTESHLVGRMLPQSDGSFKFEESPFVKTYKSGGVHLFDEVDAADANVMTFLNAALANGHLSVPQSGVVYEKHPDTVIICAANTYGTGASRQYVGRNQLDAATLDRFACSTVEVGYDRELEKSIATEMLGSDDLLKRLWRIREVIEANHMRRIMSTRTVIGAHKVAAAQACPERTEAASGGSPATEARTEKAERLGLVEQRIIVYNNNQ